MSKPTFTYRQPLTIRYCGNVYDGVLVEMRYVRPRRYPDYLEGTVEFKTCGGKKTKRRPRGMPLPYGTGPDVLKAVLRAFTASKREYLVAEATKRKETVR